MGWLKPFSITDFYLPTLGGPLATQSNGDAHGSPQKGRLTKYVPYTEIVNIGHNKSEFASAQPRSSLEADSVSSITRRGFTGQEVNRSAPCPRAYKKTRGLLPSENAKPTAPNRNVGDLYLRFPHATCSSVLYALRAFLAARGPSTSAKKYSALYFFTLVPTF